MFQKCMSNANILQEMNHEKDGGEEEEEERQETDDEEWKPPAEVQSVTLNYITL